MADNQKRYVSGDVLALVAVVAGRDIKTILGVAVSRTGEIAYSDRVETFMGKLKERERENLIHCRKLHARFFRGDYRLSEPEYDQFLEAADWLQRLDRKNKQQPDKPPVNWQQHRDKAFRQTSLPPRTYQELVKKLIGGEIDSAVAG